jgi:mannose-6-phosphate isomerase-like protein (cupin superfamily)
MEEDRFFCVHEDDVEGFRVARQGSSGYVMVSRLLDPEASGSQQAIVIIAEMPPHQTESMPPHFHREYEETMYVAAGRGVFQVGASPNTMRSIPIRPGSCCYVPAEYYHRVEVEGNEALKLICAYFCASGEGGKSHRQISVELTSLPLEGTYGESAGD